MEPRLTVLTSAAGRSSGYLLEAAGRRVLVDCGPGVVGALTAHGGPEGLDAVVVTHAHADHCLDLMGMGYALRCPDPLDRRLPLLLPEGTAVVAGQLDDLFGVPTSPAMARPIAQSFALRPLSLARPESVELFPGLSLEAFPARHPVQSAALRFTVGGAVVAFSSDTTWAEPVVAAASDASLFVCEATYLAADQATLERHGHRPPGRPPGARVRCPEPAAEPSLLPERRRPGARRRRRALRRRWPDPGRHARPHAHRRRAPRRDAGLTRTPGRRGLRASGRRRRRAARTGRTGRRAATATPG